MAIKIVIDPKTQKRTTIVETAERRLILRTCETADCLADLQASTEDKSRIKDIANELRWLITFCNGEKEEE